MRNAFDVITLFCFSYLQYEGLGLILLHISTFISLSVKEKRVKKTMVANLCFCYFIDHSDVADYQKSVTPNLQDRSFIFVSLFCKQYGPRSRQQSDQNSCFLLSAL